MICRKSLKHYNGNGLVGVCSNIIFQLRAEQQYTPPSGRLPQIKFEEDTQTKRNREIIDDILKDNEVSDKYKKPFQNILEEGYLDTYPGESEAQKLKTLRDSVVTKCKNPIYSKIKRKLPYLIFVPPTFTELQRLAGYRLLGCSSAPLTLAALAGFTIPCAVAFSMLEMYAPNKLKFPCMIMKWSGGLIFYGVAGGMDYVSEGFEKRYFGLPMPIDAPNLMETLPTKHDI